MDGEVEKIVIEGDSLFLGIRDVFVGERPTPEEFSLGVPKTLLDGIDPDYVASYINGMGYNVQNRFDEDGKLFFSCERRDSKYA